MIEVQQSKKGKFCFKLRAEQIELLNDILLSFLEPESVSLMIGETKTKATLQRHLMYGVLEDWFINTRKLHHFQKEEKFNVNRAQAAALVLLLVEEESPDMIELKSNLLRKL